MKNLMTTTCLRPNPETVDDFVPLFEARNAVMEEQGRVSELMFAAARRGDMPAHREACDRLQQLKLDEEALSAQMRPLQFKAWGPSHFHMISISILNTQE
jgi:hypothetical protein